MKALVALLFLESLGLAWCCSPLPWATNIATRGEASQSSNHSIDTANKAIDGGNDLDWSHGSCAHTLNDTEPWWRLNMKQRYKIDIVEVYGRSDCCLERMKGLEVRIGDSPDNNNPVCGKISGTPERKTTFCCDGMEGQYVSVVIPGRQECLTPCEVKVYGDILIQKKHRGCG